MTGDDCCSQLSHNLHLIGFYFCYKIKQITLGKKGGEGVVGGGIGAVGGRQGAAESTPST